MSQILFWDRVLLDAITLRTFGRSVIAIWRRAPRRGSERLSQIDEKVTYPPGRLHRAAPPYQN
jgi:hypothetical protein